MKIESLDSVNAPAAIGPYSQAVAAGGFLFTSGQIGLDPATGQMVGQTIEKQTRQVFENLSAVLQHAGCDFKSVVKANVYLSAMSDFPVVNEIYAGFFGDHRPARATIEAGSLPKGALVEIDLIALI